MYTVNKIFIKEQGLHKEMGSPLVSASLIVTSIIA